MYGMHGNNKWNAVPKLRIYSCKNSDKNEICESSQTSYTRKIREKNEVIGKCFKTSKKFLKILHDYRHTP